MAIPLPLVSDDLRRLLDHSWPFLFLDTIVELEPGTYAKGIKNVTVSEPYFAGHFPRASVMPGALMLEVMAQVAGIAGASEDEERFLQRLRRPPFPSPSESEPDEIGVLAGVKRLRFRAAVVPGDRLTIHARAAGRLGEVADFNVQVKVGSHAVADGVITLANVRASGLLAAARSRQARQENE